MSDDRDGPVYDASRDDLSPLRPTPPRAGRRRSTWSPTPTTDEGRRRARRAAWGTVGVVALGLAVTVARFTAMDDFERAARARSSASRADPLREWLDLAVMFVEARGSGPDRALVYEVSLRDVVTRENAPPDVAVIVLPLPADDAAVREAALELARAAGPRRLLTFVVRPLDPDDREAHARIRATLDRLGVATEDPRELVGSPSAR